MVTIAIPIYNAESYLRNAIQSIINQTYKDWTLFLVNDGSTDGSLSIMQEFAALDNRIQIINDGQNKGLIARLNQSISLAKTKYYARMDADDIMYVTRLEEQVLFLEEHPEVDVLGTSIMTIDNKNTIIGSGLYFGSVETFVHPTVMGKVSWFRSNHYSEDAFRAEDFELWARTSSYSVFWALEKPLLFYREIGVPTLKKTIQSQKTLIRIFFNYKKYNKSMWWCFKNTIMTILKMGIYVCFSVIGCSDFIVKNRRRTPLPLKDWLTESDLNESIINKK